MPLYCVVLMALLCCNALSVRSDVVGEAASSPAALDLIAEVPVLQKGMEIYIDYDYHMCAEKCDSIDFVQINHGHTNEVSLLSEKGKIVVVPNDLGQWIYLLVFKLDGCEVGSRICVAYAEDEQVSLNIGGGKELKVASSWVSKYLISKYGAGKSELFWQKFGDNLSVALVQSTTKANGAKMYVWEDYVAGTDPTDTNSVFTAKVRMEGGFPIIEWEPNLNENGEERVYTVFGKADLKDAWHSPTNGSDRFFKVSVAMPEGNVIALSLGGGSCDADPLVVSPGDPIGTLPEPTRDGYLFDGWYTSEQGGDKVTAQTIAVEGMTIYARWKNLGEGLAHRWSFNGNLNDSVGGQTAVAVGSVAAGEKQYTLAGGAGGSSYIDLGDNILPTGTAGTTIELWATRRGAQKLSRVLDVGSGTGNYLHWDWLNDEDPNNDSCGIYKITGTSDRHSGVAFVQDNEYHLSIVIKPVSTYWEISFVKRSVSSGAVLSTVVISSQGFSWTPSSLGQTNCWLGHSQWSGDRDANASYNEVRIWNRALTDEELSKSAKAGPDKLAL